MVRRVDPHGEALVWRKNFSGYVRCRLRPKLMNRCRSEKKDTHEYWKMWKIILKIEEGRVPNRNAKGWKVEGKVKESPGKSARGCWKNLKLEVSWRKKVCGTLRKTGCKKTERSTAQSEDVGGRREPSMECA